jgi:hypothetical protein
MNEAASARRAGSPLPIRLAMALVRHSGTSLAGAARREASPRLRSSRGIGFLCAESLLRINGLFVCCCRRPRRSRRFSLALPSSTGSPKPSAFAANALHPRATPLA